MSLSYDSMTGRPIDELTRILSLDWNLSQKNRHQHTEQKNDPNEHEHGGQEHRITVDCFVVPDVMPKAPMFMGQKGTPHPASCS